MNPIRGKRIRRIDLPVSTLLPGLEERTRLRAIVQMSLKLAGERDPEVLLRSVSHMAREIVPSEYASVGILGEDGGTIRRTHGRGRHAGRPGFAAGPSDEDAGGAHGSPSTRRDA
jgi:hypothetical protein